jgi:hypothetical protein
VQEVSSALLLDLFVLHIEARSGFAGDLKLLK